jgi:hypothetical protein
VSRRRGPEGKIQDAVIAYARETHNALCKKNETGRNFVSSGWPDYTIYPDKHRRPKAEVFTLEFKAPGEDYTPLQAHVRDELVARGHRVYKVDNVAQGKKIVDNECS